MERWASNGALSELCDFLDFSRCVEFILKLKDSSKQDLCEYRILSLVHPPTCVISLFLRMVWSWEVNVASCDVLLLGSAVAAASYKLYCLLLED